MLQLLENKLALAAFSVQAGWMESGCAGSNGPKERASERGPRPPVRLINSLQPHQQNPEFADER